MSSTTKKQCTAISQSTGKRCKNHAVARSQYCSVHKRSHHVTTKKLTPKTETKSKPATANSKSVFKMIRERDVGFEGVTAPESTPQKMFEASQIIFDMLKADTNIVKSSEFKNLEYQLLRYAIYVGHVQLVQYLMKHGVNPELTVKIAPSDGSGKKFPQRKTVYLKVLLPRFMENDDFQALYSLNMAAQTYEYYDVVIEIAKALSDD